MHARRGGAGELFEFEYEQAALADPLLALAPIDPRIGLFDGPQYPAQGRDTFGVFSDSSPDRWGRMLMNRRLDRDKRAARVPSHTRLFESDYLLGVHDAFRVGALRFKRDDLGPFLDEREGLAAPRWCNCVNWRLQVGHWKTITTIPPSKASSGYAC